MTDPTVRVGINGFGRIGRSLLRAVWSRPDAAIEVAAVNDIQPAEQLAYLLAHDSVAGPWAGGVEVIADDLVAGDRRVRLLAEPEPHRLPWGELGVDVVVESSRRFVRAADARAHLDAGAVLVIVSAPSAGADATFVVGVNDGEFDAGRHRVVSNASCTTNCVAPMAAVLDDAFGIEDGLMTTVHAYTSDQALVDGAHDRFRESRAAALNVIPTTTGAARAIGLVAPSLQGRLDGRSLRVPVADGSITDLTVALRTSPTAADVNAAFRAAASAGPLAGILEYSEAPLVSSDVVGRAASCVFDAPLTMAGQRLVKVFGWYDNEWGYANRLVDLAGRLGARLRVPAGRG